MGAAIGRGALGLAPKARLLKPSRASPHHPGMIEVKKVGDRPIKHFSPVGLPACGSSLVLPLRTSGNFHSVCNYKARVPFVYMYLSTRLQVHDGLGRQSSQEATYRWRQPSLQKAQAGRGARKLQRCRQEEAGGHVPHGTSLVSAFPLFTRNRALVLTAW